MVPRSKVGACNIVYLAVDCSFSDSLTALGTGFSNSSCRDYVRRPTGMEEKNRERCAPLAYMGISQPAASDSEGSP